MPEINPLSEVSGYRELLTYYEENQADHWQDWLSFEDIFNKPGKQGLVGLLSMKNKESEKKYIFKISQYIDYLIYHESVIMKGLNEMAHYCLHFCKSVGTIVCDVDPKSTKTSNPFDIKSKYPIKKEALLCEYIDKSCKFYNYIRSPDKIPEDVLYSTIKQVLMGISIAQRKKQFSHYDLHSFNIMMRKCNKDVVFLYALDDENQFAVPTQGHYPVIIDFGFSYINNMEDGPLWTSMAHTDVGFMSDRFDWVADPKLFLVTVSSEIKGKRDSSKARKLRRIVRNVFHPLDIDWSSGWDKDCKESAADYVTRMLEKHNTSSPLFEDFDHYCIDILQSLIILPIEQQDYSNIHTAYTSFLKEWAKI